MDTQWIINLFGIIGIIIAVVVLVIALVWLVCFVVRLLIKTFGVKVKSSYELMVEDITKKAKAKRLRNEKKRKAKAQEKQELLDMKLASNHKIFLMKRQKLQKELEAKENEEKQKNLGEDVFFEQAQEELFSSNRKKHEDELETDVVEAEENVDEIETNEISENLDDASQLQVEKVEEKVEQEKTKEEVTIQEENKSSSGQKSQKKQFNQGINIIDALAKEEKESDKNSNKK